MTLRNVADEASMLAKMRFNISLEKAKKTEL